MQLTFGDVEGMGKRNRACKEIFLADVDKLMPRAAVPALIAPPQVVLFRWSLDG